MWKFPELVDDVIPWVALLIAWHLTWEFILDTKPMRRWAMAAGRRVNPMLIWFIVFMVGGAVSSLYWVGVNRGLVRLASMAAQRVASKQTPSLMSPPKTLDSGTKAQRDMAIQPKLPEPTLGENDNMSKPRKSKSPSIKQQNSKKKIK